MQTQNSKKSRSSKSSSSASSRNLPAATTSPSIPSFNSIKEEAIRAFKESAGERLDSFSAFLPEGVVDNVPVYAEKAVKWLRKNPGAATAVAVLSGVAVGAMVRQALIGGTAMSSSSKNYNS